MAPTITITDLADLNFIKDGHYANIFSQNLKQVFNYSSVVIKKILNDRDHEILKDLRDMLVKQVAETYESYAGKLPIDRRTKQKVIDDILLLGDTVAKNQITANLDSVYKNDPDLTQELANLPILASVIAQL